MLVDLGREILPNEELPLGIESNPILLLFIS